MPQGLSCLVFARLADPAHVLPMPGQPGSVFPAEGRFVDPADPLWGLLLADGSLVRAEPAPVPPPAAAPEPGTSPVSPRGANGASPARAARRSTEG